MSSDPRVQTKIKMLVDTWNAVLGIDSPMKAERAGKWIRLPLPHPFVPGLWSKHDIKDDNLLALDEALRTIMEINAVNEVVAEIRAAGKTKPTESMLRDIEAKEMEILARELNGEMN